LKEEAVPAHAVTFFALFEDGLCDVTRWLLSSHLVRADDGVGVVDALKPLFFVDNGVASLNPRLLSLGSTSSGSKKDSSAATTKDKLSRADKKAKKLQYRR